MPVEQDDSSNRPYIKEILLQDFMCHHNFEIKLGSGLNLIYGTNGSGKSTILTAIMVALGGRARSTSRSENLGGLVRTGCNNCWISIKFHVPPHVSEIFMKYGRELTVLRKINVKGSSQFSLKDSCGRPIPKAGLKQVQEICFHFGIYPENEMAMLSQEKAKEFLVHATNQAKYDKLQRALQQQLIRANIEAVASMDEAQRSKIDELKLREETAKLAVERAEEVLARAKTQNKRRQKIAQIMNILAWRQFDEPKAQLDALKDTLQSTSLELSELETRTDNLGLMPILQENMSNLIDEVNRLKAAKMHVDNEVSAVESDIQPQKYNIKRMNEDLLAVERELAENESELDSLNHKLANHSPEAIERELKRLKLERDDVGQRKVESEAEQSVIEQKIEEYKANIESHERFRSNLRNEINELRLTLRSLNDELRDLASGKTHMQRRSPLDKYHKDLKRLVDSTPGWREKPIGPLYETIELDDDGASYSPALERLWTNTLDSWWVQNDADRNKLMNLAKRIRFDSLRVVLRKDDAFEFENALPSESKEYHRAVDLLQVKSDAIRRILVDLNSIETLVLVESIEAAFNAINNKRIRSSLAITKTQRGTTEFTLVTVSGPRRDSSRVQPFGYARMKIGTKARQRQVDAEVKELLSSLSELEDRISREEGTLVNLREKCDLERRNLTKQVNIARKCSDDISDFSSQIVALEIDVGAQSFLNDIERIKPIIDAKRNEIAYFKETLAANVEELEKLQSHKAEKSKLSDEHLSELNASKTKLRDLEKEIRKTEADAAQAESRLRRKRERVTKLQDEVARAESQNSDLAEGITNEHGPRLNSDEDSVRELHLMEDFQLTRELRLLQNEAEVAAASNLELEAARNEEIEAARVRKEAKHNRIQMEKVSKEIRKRHVQRLENEHDAWEKLKDRVGTSFSKFLQGRNFSGRVIINDDKKSLQIEAAPEASSKRSLATLSGGEKSFTQVALLMSIWKSMSVGLVAMDEYDVFMDKINRSFSLHLLAKTVDKGNMQCLLITPQDVDTAVLNDSKANYKLHKLTPANR